MNAERLLELYDRISDAPDAIPRLRRFVLDLAVRGKLVEQDPDDEPASELLKRIAAEKARLVKAGEIRKSKPLPYPEPDDLAFPFPLGWAVATISQILITLQTGPFGSSLHQSDYQKGGIPVINPASIKNGRLVPIEGMSVGQATLERLATFKLQAGDIVMGRRGELGRCAVVTEQVEGWLCGTGSLILRLPHCVYPRFVAMLISSPFVRAYLGESAVGATMQNLNQSILLSLVIAIPPLHEQHRIVAKVDELMALLDRLEAARTASEAIRDRLTTASLARLTAPDTTPEAFPAHARFALDALPGLTTRPDQIKSLRQTILNLAVRGKLVEQDPADEPLPRIDQGVPDHVERPFQIPPSWQWSRLRELGNLKGGGTPSKARDDFWNGSIPWVSPKDMKVDYIEEAQLRITDDAIAGSAVNLIEPESILFVVRGMILAHSFPVAVSRVPLTINQDMKAIALKKPEMAEYVLRALKGLTPEMLARVQRSSHGTCRIEGSDYGNLLIPLPPFAEQHRIVARVDELMALCDRLETALATADTTKQRLLEALLHEALAPAATPRETVAA